MAWITTISPDRASGELADTYAQIAAARGGVAQVHQVQSLNPRAMAAHVELYKSIVFQGSSLTRAQREGLAVTVSLTVAYFSFVNRVVLALGVPLETGFEMTCGPE